MITSMMCIFQHMIAVGLTGARLESTNCVKLFEEGMLMLLFLSAEIILLEDLLTRQLQRW